MPIVSRNKFNDQTATTQVDLTIRIVKFTKSHYDNNRFFLIWGQVRWYDFERLPQNCLQLLANYLQLLTTACNCLQTACKRLANYLQTACELLLKHLNNWTVFRGVFQNCTDVHWITKTFKLYLDELWQRNHLSKPVYLRNAFT